MIRMCGVRLVDSVSIVVLRDRVCVVMNIKCMIIQNCMVMSSAETSNPKYLRGYGASNNWKKKEC